MGVRDFFVCPVDRSNETVHTNILLSIVSTDTQTVAMYFTETRRNQAVYVFCFKRDETHDDALMR